MGGADDTSGGRGLQGAVDQVAWSRGFGYGFVAGLVGLIASEVLLFVDFAMISSGPYASVSQGAIVTRGIGMFWASHLGAFPQRLVLRTSMPIPLSVFYLIPLVVLVWAGRRSASGVGDATSEGAALQGASIAAGYVLIVLVSVFLIEAVITFSSVAERLWPRIVVMAGIVYPVVLGGVG